MTPFALANGVVTTVTATDTPTFDRYKLRGVGRLNAANRLELQLKGKAMSILAGIDTANDGSPSDRTTRVNAT